jgi:hypothetical protein
VSEREDAPDTARGWVYVEGLLLEEELARLEKLGEEELEEELWKAGLDPSRVPTAEALIAKAEARATAKRIDPAEAEPPQAEPAEVKPAEVKPAEAKPAEVKPAEVKPAEVKPAEVKPAEAKPAEVKPAEAEPAEAKPAEAKPAEAKPAEPRPLGEPAGAGSGDRRPSRDGSVSRWRRRVAAVAVAVTAAAAVGYVAVNQLPDVSSSPARRAAVLRAAALAACDKQDWSTCREKLDDAAGLDPSGESVQEVVYARAKIAKAEQPR